MRGVLSVLRGSVSPMSDQSSQIRRNDSPPRPAAQASEGDCLFCKIVAGQIPADVVAEGENVLAFNDINPQAPLHVLVIPREHYADVASLAAADPDLLAELVAEAKQVASAYAGSRGDNPPRPANGDFRLVFNSGESAGQSVHHVHGHVLGGKQLGWSPA
jgi:histidine triad (HIT) family protein